MMALYECTPVQLKDKKLSDVFSRDEIEALSSYLKINGEGRHMVVAIIHEFVGIFPAAPRLCLVKKSKMKKASVC